MVIPNLPDSGNGRPCRDGNIVLNQTQILQNSRFILAKTRFPVEKWEDQFDARQQRFNRCGSISVISF